MMADVYVDLGTANTLVSVKDKGLVVNEPTLIVYTERRKGRRDVVGVGLDAQQKLEQTPGILTVFRPLKDGVITDSDVSETLLRHYFSKLDLTGFLRKPRVILSLPYGVTDVEKRALVKAGKSAGAKEVILVDEPMLAAIGAGLDVEAAQGVMVLDLGGGTTEVAVIALADIVYCQAVRFGGHHFDLAVQNYLKNRRALVVSDSSAEKIKIELGTAAPKKDIRFQSIRGRDADSGLHKNVDVSSEEIGSALDDGINQIMHLVHGALEQTPPELVSDLIETGITLTGGGALIQELDLRLQNEVRLPVRVASEPLLTIARGGLKLLDNPNLLKKIQLD